MKVTPYTGNRYGPRPVALVRPGMKTMEVWTDWAHWTSDRPLDDLLELEGHRIYCTTGVTSMRLVTDARGWTVTVWNGRASSIALDGTGVVVNNTRGALEASVNPWGALRRFLGWVGARGVNPATVGTMATNMWRSTLEAPLRLQSDPVITAPAFFGGRQGARPGTYRRAAHYDIRAAYPHSMATEGYPLSLVPCRVDEGYRSTDPVICRADVIIPDMLYGPLPVRHPIIRDLVTYPTGAAVSGNWAARELEAARDMGCRVHVREAWVPGQEPVDLFGAWWALMEEGRRLPGDAAGLAKVLSNTLWGTFAMDGALSQWKWSTRHGNDRPRQVAGIPGAVSEGVRRLPHAWAKHIAVETTARVRTRLYREGLLEASVPPLHLDTDGLIVRASAPCPRPMGPEPGQWRKKWIAPTIEIAAPQTYRRTCIKGCGERHPRWHYTAAGRTEAEARLDWASGVTTSIIFDEEAIPLNRILERKNALRRQALSQADMEVRDPRWPDLSSQEQERMFANASR